MDTLKNNKAIAKFMGLEIITDGITWFDTNLKSLGKYNKSWDLLMPVVEKCLETGENTDEWDHLLNELQTVEIDKVYVAVVEFIESHNTQ